MGLLMLGARLPLDLAEMSELASILAGLFTTIMVFSLGLRLGLSRAAALVAPVLLALTGDFAFYMGSGLETTFFVGMVALCMHFVAMADSSRAIRHPLLPLALAVMILTRPEGLLIAAVIIIGLAWRSRRWWWTLWPILGTAAFIAPVQVALERYYGDWLPNTYYAKAGGVGLANLGQGTLYLSSFIEASVAFG